jgi:hypothetical protein
MARDYTFRPPVSFITDAEMRELFHHNYQVFDVLNGSGDPSLSPISDQLKIDNVTGTGPLYDIDIIYSGAHPDSGVKLVQVGDNLLMGEADYVETGGSIPEPMPNCWYRYRVGEILNLISEESGRFRVEYIVDTCDTAGGDQTPTDNCHGDTGTGGYGDTCNDSRVVIYRELNTPHQIVY